MLDGVKLTRIDYRLIHGQVITKWTNKAAANRIIVVNDELAKDKFMASVYTMSAHLELRYKLQQLINL